MKTTFIYILVDPRDDKVRYIGKSNNPKKRLEGHLGDKKKTHKCNWIKSLTTLNLRPIIETIDEVLESEWQFWEVHYISLYKSWGFDLTNSTKGGEGQSVGYKASEETKAKQKRALLSRYAKMSLEEKEILKNKLAPCLEKARSVRRSKGWIITKDMVQKQVASRKKKAIELGYYHSEVTKNKIGNSNKNKPSWSAGLTARTCKSIEQRVEKQYKKILQYNLKGEFIQEWSSIREIERKLKIGSTQIVDCCKERSNTAGGFIFRYKTDIFHKTIKGFQKTYIVQQYDKNNNLINTFNSAKDASSKMLVSIEAIRKACSGKYKTLLGYIWKYQTH